MKLSSASLKKAISFIRNEGRPLEKAMEKNLDYEIQNQEEDGSWKPFWNWAGHTRKIGSLQKENGAEKSLWTYSEYLPLSVRSQILTIN